MRLPHLDQTLELDRGEAGELCWLIAGHYQRAVAAATLDPPRRVSAGLLLALPVLQRVAKRLHALDQREQRVVGKPTKKPRRFRLQYDEVIVLLRYLVPGPVSSVVLGKVQQVSLNLTSYIDFTRG